MFKIPRILSILNSGYFFNAKTSLNFQVFSGSGDRLDTQPTFSDCSLWRDNIFIYH